MTAKALFLTLPAVFLPVLSQTGRRRPAGQNDEIRFAIFLQAN